MLSNAFMLQYDFGRVEAMRYPLMYRRVAWAVVFVFGGVNVYPSAVFELYACSMLPNMGY